MLKQVSLISASLVLLSVSVLPVDAQSFVSRRRAAYRSSAALEQQSRDFNRELGETAERMRINHARMEAMNSARLEANARANQIDTGTAAQNGFINSQIHAVNSGGLYNTPVRTNPWWW